jgi:hypothetical protein
MLSYALLIITEALRGAGGRIMTGRLGASWQLIPLALEHLDLQASTLVGSGSGPRSFAKSQTTSCSCVHRLPSNRGLPKPPLLLWSPNPLVVP